MARSENQGLQIAVIIFAFLTIALSVFTFYFFNDASTQHAAAVAEQKKVQEKDVSLRAQVSERGDLAEVIGMARDAPLKDLKDKHAEAVAVFNGLPLAQNNKTSISVLQSLKTWCDQINQERQDQKKKIEDLEKQNAAIQANYTAEVDKEKAAYKADRDKALAENEKLIEEAKGRDGKLAEVAAKLAKAEADVIKATEDKAKELLAKDKEMEDLRKQMREVLQKQYEAENWVFERPDGNIVSVNPRTQTVNIDVGRADYLRLGIHFAVFKRGETNVYKRTKKGTIAVTRFIEDNLAEARIVESDLKDPILAGDVVFTPTWTPGTQETFVLAGDFDINEDRKPDNEIMETLVDMNGGKILDKVGIHVRYLLLGAAPPAADKERRDKFDSIVREAKQYGIKEMSLKDFIEYTGSGETLRQLQRQGSAEEAGPILKGGKRPAAGDASFRAREPDGRRIGPSSPQGEKAGAGGKGKNDPPRRSGGVR
jgi:hypothetical protein